MSEGREIGIGERLGEHPRTPGPRLMRLRSTGPVAVLDEESQPPMHGPWAEQARRHRAEMVSERQRQIQHERHGKVLAAKQEAQIERQRRIAARMTALRAQAAD